jgi:hypothetical protein
MDTFMMETLEAVKSFEEQHKLHQAEQAKRDQSLQVMTDEMKASSLEIRANIDYVQNYYDTKIAYAVQQYMNDET